MDDNNVFGKYGNSPFKISHALLLCVVLIACIYFVWYSFFDNSLPSSQSNTPKFSHETNVKPSKSSSINPFSSSSLDDGTNSIHQIIDKNTNITLIKKTIPISNANKSKNNNNTKSSKTIFHVPAKKVNRPVAIDNRQYVKNVTGQEHKEWLEQFYDELNSPGFSTVNEDDTLSVIAGRVLTTSGTPLAGIEVTAKLRKPFNTPNIDTTENHEKPPATVFRTITNDNGFYAIPDIPEGVYMLSTQEFRNYAAARIQVRTGVKYADLILELQQIAQITGTVTDVMGTQLDGVRIMPLVKGTPKGTTSNPYGEFQFAVPMQGEIRDFPVRFQLQGYREVRQQITATDLLGKDQLAISVVMEPVNEITTVRGSVRDNNGVQVAGETVRLYSPSLRRSYRAKSDASGEYFFSKVEVADDYKLWINTTGPYRDFSTNNLQLSSGNLIRDIELQSLDRGYRLSGRILNPEGQPIPNFSLIVRSNAANDQKLPLVSDSAGYFQIDNVPEGELVIRSRSMPFYTLSGLKMSSNEKDRYIDLVVNRGQYKLIGKVVARDGSSVPTPKVSISTSQLINGIRSTSSSTTSTNASGNFLFTNLSPGQHTVTINAVGYEAVRLKPVVGNQNELIVMLEKNSI